MPSISSRDNITAELLEVEGNPKVSPQIRLGQIDKLCGLNFILVGIDIPDLMVGQSAFERYSELQKPLCRGLRNRIHQGQINADKLDRKRLLNLLGIRRIEMNNIAAVSILGKVDELLKEANVNGIEHYLSVCEAQGRVAY